MKSIIKVVAVAAVVVAPVLSFAQSDTNSAVTRSQVKQDLQQVEAAGYNPAAGDRTTYPADVQAAEGRAARQNGAASANDSAYGGSDYYRASTGSRAMPPVNNDGSKPTYFGH
ncbi:DUF4148 domain-containing protein [Caballeronia sp. LP006]|uniref:DUF4148 domain-containing protein n=1 Tax=unclassified Caballeronia TaxID=2646786 RepID=UPI001FD0DC5D|nr:MULTISPECIES: DUF4148 domain-containing protein [unclassified Caballeronia]MDR5775524.1 DUF4148 domain-containing protein [Caballeronia sp. LZ002]MDR5828692.1 DUF4148 domain-containing protein [Caballeronia sp. LP006]MDR5850962.1 DUF4148 domain-containing protein [Caballeronia sp. LZ003]